MILGHVDHAILFDQSRIVLECHSISRLSFNHQQDWERSVIIQMLYHTLSTFHSRKFLCTCNFIKFRFPCAQIGKDKADIGFITHNGGYAGIDIQVIALGDIIITFGSTYNTLLSNNRIEPAILIAAIPVILLHNNFRAVYIINPIRDIPLFIAYTFTCYRIHRNNTFHIRTAEQHDFMLQYRINPIWIA